MSKNNEFNRFLPEVEPEKHSVDIPAQPPPQYDRVPSGYEPIGEIELRGRVVRGLANGRTAWWVLISGWIIFGGLVWLMIKISLISPAIVAWIFATIAAVPLLILLKGTKAKFRNKRRRH